MARHREEASSIRATVTTLVFICVFTRTPSAANIADKDRPTLFQAFSKFPTVADRFPGPPDQQTKSNKLSSQRDQQAIPNQFSSQPDRPIIANHFSSQPDRPTLPEQFHVIVEWNDLYNNRTVLLEEWYDEHTQKGTVTSMSDGIQFTKIMDFQTKEMFEIADNFCVTVNMTKSTDDDIFGKGDKMLTPSGVLRFGGGMNENYVGKAEARGIACHLWVFSGPIPDLEIKEVNILWYFADPERWESAIGKSKIPVVSTWYGTKVDDAGKDVPFAYQYEYLKWEPGLTGDPRIFQTPAGVFCAGRKNRKVMPQLPPQFTLTIEEVKAISQLKRTTRFWYDQTRLLARYDHMPTIVFDDMDDIDDFDGRPLKEIHDFHTGLAYTIDALRGNCSIRSLSNSIDSKPPFDGDDSPFPIMKEPAEIFSLDNAEFHYVGRKIIRDTEVDVWAGKPNIPIDPDGPPLPPEMYDYVVEWSVLANPWKAVEGVSIEGQVPMQLIIYKKNFPFQVWNFNEFDSEKVSILNFDIQSCFRAFPLRKHFQFSIAGGDGSLVGLIDDNINAFKEALIFAVEASTEVRPMRISNILIDDDEDFLYVLFSMTEAPLPGTGGIGSIGYPDIPLSEATSKLEKAILEETFVLSLILDENLDKKTFIKPVKDSLVETFRPGGKVPPTQATTNQPTTNQPTTNQPTTNQPTTNQPTQRPTNPPDRLTSSGIVVSVPTLLVILLIVPIIVAGLTVCVIFVVMRRLSVLPQ